MNPIRKKQICRFLPVFGTHISTGFLTVLFLLAGTMSPSSSISQSSTIPWESTIESALERALKENKPVLYVAYSADSRVSLDYYLSTHRGFYKEIGSYVPLLVKTRFKESSWPLLWKYLYKAGSNGPVRLPVFFFLDPEGEVITHIDAPQAGDQLAGLMKDTAEYYESGRYAKREKIEWLLSVDEAFKTAKEKQRPIMLFIYSDKCGFCRLFEGSTLKNSEIIALSRQFIAVKANARTDNSISSLMWMKLKEGGYNKSRAGYPFVGLLSSDGRTLEYISGLDMATGMKGKMMAVISKYESK